MSPYKDEYSCRLKNSEGDCFSEDGTIDGKPVRYIICDNGKTSIRFPASDWSESSAKKVCSKEGGDFHTTKKEADSMGDATNIDEGAMILESGSTEPPFQSEFQISGPIQDEEKETTEHKISGSFGPLDEPNGNLYFYGEEGFADSVSRAGERINSGRLIGQIRHPSISLFSMESPDPKEWCVVWDNVTVKDNMVHYEGRVMDTPAGHLLVDIANSGVNWLVSPRGYGKKIWVENDRLEDADEDAPEGYYKIEDYSLLAIDFTLTPAFSEQEFVMDSIEAYKSAIDDSSEGDVDEPVDDLRDEDEAVEPEHEIEEEEQDADVDEPENDEATLDEDVTEDEVSDDEDEEDDIEDEEDEDYNEVEDDEDIVEDNDGEVEEGDEEDNDVDETVTDSVDPSIDNEGNDSEEDETEEEIKLSDKLDERTMSILRGTALTDFANGVVDGWISDGDVSEAWREQAVDMIKTDAETIEDAEANARHVLPVMRKASAIEIPEGDGVVDSNIIEGIDELPKSVDGVIQESISRIPEGLKRAGWERMLDNYKGNPQNERVLATHTQRGRKMLADATYSNVDLVYTDFVLPIIERAWIELQGPELVATFPVKSPQGFIPKLFFEVDGSSGTYLEDYYYKYFDHTEGNDKKEAKLAMSSQTYSVVERAIAFEWSDNLAYDLQQLYGRDAENMLVSATARRLSNEIDMHIIDTMVAAANASTSTVTYGTQPPGTTRQDIWWTKGFQAHLTALETMVYENSFTHPNFILCGQNAWEMLMMSGDMITAERDIENEKATYGLNYTGVFQGRFDIYYTTYMPNDTMVMGHAPRELSTSGVVFLPYVLGIMTDRSVNPKKNTMERALHSRYAIERLNDEVYGLMNVWNSVGSWPF